MTNHISFSNQQESCVSSTLSAIVSEVLNPRQMGVVHYRGRWIAAICDLPVTIQPYSVVKVVHDYGDHLSVIPLNY